MQQIENFFSKKRNKKSGLFLALWTYSLHTVDIYLMKLGKQYI